MSNSEQVEQAFRERHAIIARVNQLFDFYDAQLRSQNQQIETLSKNKLQKTETETVPKREDSKKK
jgi:hypothetical protein